MTSATADAFLGANLEPPRRVRSCGVSGQHDVGHKRVATGRGVFSVYSRVATSPGSRRLRFNQLVSLLANLIRNVSFIVKKQATFIFE